MSWWRRDPSLFCRSPVHRYAQRVFQDREDAIRARCFSKTPACPAQHESDDGSKRPGGLTNLEWLQLQHYTTWRNRLRDDPYQAMFGASNDMLSGRGLKDWEWIYKSFPKWMLTEMELDDKHDRKNAQRTCSGQHIKCYANNTQRNTATRLYPNRTEVAIKKPLDIQARLMRVRHHRLASRDSHHLRIDCHRSNAMTPRLCPRLI